MRDQKQEGTIELYQECLRSPLLLGRLISPFMKFQIVLVASAVRDSTAIFLYLKARSPL